MSTNTKLIKDKITKFKVFPKKKLGQHFLINPQITQKIILAVKNLKPAEIIEIGPGWGALTKNLIQLKKNLRVIETDEVLAQYWRDKGVFVLNTSALKINWHHQTEDKQGHQSRQNLPHKQNPPHRQNLPCEQTLPCEQKPPHKNTVLIKKGTVLVGNLPFNISSRLLVQLCPGPPTLKAMVFMFQKEVAQRILSKHKCKNYGILSVLSQCFWDIELLLSTGKVDFYPRPQVAGQVLIFRQKKHSILNPKSFLAFVKFCFSQRRKTLFTRLCRSYITKPSHNTLSPLIKVEQHLTNLFDKINIDRLVRAEALSPSQFEKLFNELQKNTTKNAVF